MIRSTNHMRQTLFVLFTILTFGLTAQSTFTVTNTNDSGAGSLRQAITDANASSGADIIDMTDISGTILLESALPKINECLTINGPGEHLLSISGQELYRPFFANSGTINLNNFSIINGLAKGGDGGSESLGGGGGAGMGGGLIANLSVNLTLEGITFSNNQAIGGKGGGGPNGNRQSPGSSGGAGPFFGATPPTGRTGGFGSGGSSGIFKYFPSSSGNTTGGNGGYGAGGGAAGHAFYRDNDGAGIPIYTPGSGGKFGGNGGLNCSVTTSLEGGCDLRTGGSKQGGGGAGLGGALFSRASSIFLTNVTFIDNSATGGQTASQDTGHGLYTSRGQGKGGALFIYSETGNVTDYSLNGIALSGNSAQDALNLDTDNGDIYLEDGLSFVDNTVFALRRSDPEDGGNYINGQPIVFFYNQEIFSSNGDPIAVEDVESNIQFKNSQLEDIPFTVSVNINRISISPQEDLIPNENYSIFIGTIYDRDGVARSGGSAQFQIDTNAPGFDISPANNQLIISRSFQLKANEAIFKLDGSDIQDADVSAIVTVKLADENGADVPFSGSIVNNTLHIDITDPIANQTYYVAVNSVEDLAGNEHTTARTFSIKSPAGLAFTSDPANGGVLGKRLFSINADQALYDLDDTPLTSEDLTSKLALKETDMNGADIAFDAFVEGKSIYIATNQLASASTYWVSVQGIEDITGIEIAQQEFTFSTTNLFNPVSGSGHAVSFFGGKLDFTSIEITGDFTLEAWVKTTDEDGMLLGNSNPSNLGFGLESGKLTFNTTAQSVVSTSSINDGTLHHVAMTNEAGSINLYIDGVLDGTGTVIVASTRTVTALGNGFMGNNPSQLTADIDEVRIWNVALDATNIANYQSISLDNTHPNLSDLVALFAFDESKGQYALDYNGSLVNGILSGDYSWKTSEVTFPAAQFEISVNGQVIVLDGSYDMGSVVLNQSSAPKTFQIENTGTADLLLRGNPFVGITGLGASQFTIDEASTVSLLAPGATTSFTVTYSPTIAGLSQAALIIENGSINDPFKLSLKGTGLDITTSGNWQLLGGRPGAFHVDGGVGSVVYNGELYTTSVSKDGTQQGIFKLVGEDLVYYGNSNRQPYLYASSGGTFFTTAKQAGGNVIRSIVDYGGGSISSGYQFNVPSQPTGVSTSYESEFTMGFDSQDNSFVVYAANFAEPAAFNAATGGLDIKKFVQNGSGYEDYAQLSTQSLKPGTYFGNENIYSYDIDFDSNDNLWVVSKGYRYDLFLSKYNDTNDTWTHYDLTSNLNGTYYSRDLKMEIDGDDNIHILDKVQFDNKLKYLKVASNGSVLVSDEHTASMKTTDKRFELAIGTDNNPIIVYVDDNTKRFRAIKHENGAFANFRNTHITNDLAPSGDRYFDFSIDPVTGKAYLVYISETIYGKSIVTTSEIVPELSFSIGDKLVSGEVPVVLQSGVGYEKALVLNIANDGQSIVNFTGNPHLTGDNVEDIEFDFDTFPTSLFPGESVDVPVTFFPTAVYESEVTLAFPSNATGSGSEVTFKLFGLDDTNSGNWILYTDSNLGAMNSIDMTLYNGEPIWVSNRARYKGGFQNPNRGNQFETLYTVQLELFDASSTEPLATRDYFSNDVNAAPTLIWDEFYLNQFQNLKIEIDPALDVPTLITNGVNGVSTYVPNTDGGFESLIREGYNEFGDLVFDSSNEFYYLKLESSNLVIRRGLDNSYVVSFSGLSNPNTDMDLEAYGDDLYFTYGDNTSLEVRSTAKNAATNSDMTTLLSASDVRFSQAAQSKTKDLEFSYDGQLYLAYIINSTGNVAFKSYDKLATSWTDLPTLDLSSVLPDANAIQDIQLEIHPDGSPYISIVYDDSPTNGFSIVFRLENNVWVQQSSANFFTYGGTNVSDSPVGHVAETEPIIKKSVLEISDEGTIYWLSGFKLNMMIPTPDAFDKVPSFATTPSTSTVEESSSFAYDIVVEDADAGDAITIFATGVPSWLTFTDNGDRTASLIGTPSDEDVADYTITLTASDGRISVTQEVAIEVTNINDDPDFFIEDIIYYIDQNNQGMTIEISGITDGDAGLEQNLTFSVTSDNTALVNNQSVNYIAGESTATLEFSHNQEVHGDAYLTVRLEDEVGLFKEQVVRINVVEGIVYLIASNPSGTLLFDENQPEGTEIATIFASDVDFNETYTFSLVAGLGDNQNDLFNVVENSLQLTGNLNYESVSTPSIRLRGDNGEGTTYETYFIISLNDLNDAPTDILLPESTIDEGAEVGSVIGTLSATDEDAANVHTYTLVDGFGDNASFQIVGNELQVAEVFDFDDKSSYSIRVELDDSGLTLTRDFTITVNNINVAPSAITLSNSSIPENSYGGVLIGSLSAVDGDDEDTHTFGFTGVAGLETDDFKLINGDLYTNRNFDFETESFIEVEIAANDGNGGTYSEVLTVTITDANDVPTGLTISSSEILEAQPAG
ncbi:MAG: LamG-like jellyroll fold domain-containing protein, partial [Cyclobacteriaceae bacterium]